VPSFLIGAHAVDPVTNFTYLGVTISSELGRSSSNICWGIEIAKSLFSQLEVALWKTPVSLATKIRHLQVLVLPALLYGAETCVTSQAYVHCLDAFDMWCQRKILAPGWMDRITYITIRRRTGLQPVSALVRGRRLSLLGHNVRQCAESDSKLVMQAAMDKPPLGWKRQRGRPCSTWLREVEDDLITVNLG